MTDYGFQQIREVAEEFLREDGGGVQEEIIGD